jgi:hypothetical protein
VFDDPADAAEVAAGFDAAAGDADLDPAPVQVGAAARVVLTLVGLQLLQPPSGPAGPVAVVVDAGVGFQ